MKTQTSLPTGLHDFNQVFRSALAARKLAPNDAIRRKRGGKAQGRGGETVAKWAHVARKIGGNCCNSPVYIDTRWVGALIGLQPATDFFPPLTAVRVHRQQGRLSGTIVGGDSGHVGWLLPPRIFDNHKLWYLSTNQLSFMFRKILSMILFQK